MSFEIASVGIWAALFAGMISFLSPCVLPLIPGYISYIAGNNPQIGIRSRSRTLLLSGCFVLGFSTIFILLGASATAFGRLLLSYRSEANLVGGMIVLVFGAFTTGLVRPPWLMRDLRFHGSFDGGHPLGAYLLGLAFGFGWTPCIGPILGAILTVSATVNGVADGVALLSIYSVGLGMPFLLSALFADALTARLRRAARLGRALHVAAGVVMMVMGIAMITGQMSAFAFWLLETFPVFSRIG